MELKNKIKNYYINSNSVQKIIIINILIFIFPLLIKTILHLFNLNDIDIVSFFTIESDLLKIVFKPWSVLTYGFFHSGFYHLFWNMLMLYYFGNRLQNLFGDKLFYNIFFNGIIFGALLYVVSYNVFPVFKGSESQMIGASAGVMAVLFYLSSYNPNLRIRLFIVDVKLIYIALFLLILDIIQIPNGNSGGHIAHIGGALTGYCLLKYNYQGLNLPSIMSFFKFSKNIKKTKIKFDKIDQKKIDIILDKISESGYDSLSKDEKNYLFKAGNKNDKN